MAEMSKEQLILECVKIVTPHIFATTRGTLDPTSLSFIKKCSSAGFTLAGEIITSSKILKERSNKKK